MGWFKVMGGVTTPFLQKKPVFDESKGWKIGANKMKDWKAAIRTWESRNKNKPQTISKIKNQLHTHKKAKEIINKINNK